MAVLQGLGYPGQNRSHFKTITIWKTGGDGNRSGKTEWLTEDIKGLKAQIFWVRMGSVLMAAWACLHRLRASGFQ